MLLSYIGLVDTIARATLPCIGSLQRTLGFVRVGETFLLQEDA